MDLTTTEKSAITKKMNLIAGARPALPGQNREHEQMLRADFAAYFGATEYPQLLWIVGMARCQAAIEVFDAQIAAVQIKQVRRACESKIIADGFEASTPGERASRGAVLQRRYAAHDFRAPRKEYYLSDPEFGDLLAEAPEDILVALRMLQQLKLSETKERDRLINQLERRQRLKFRDQVLADEAARRAALFEKMMAEGPLPDLRTTTQAALPRGIGDV